MTEEGAHRPGSWNGGAPIQTVRRQQANEMERSQNLLLDLREHRLAEALGFHSDPNCRTATTACAAAWRGLGIPPPQRIALDNNNGTNHYGRLALRRQKDQRGIAVMLPCRP